MAKKKRALTSLTLFYSQVFCKVIAALSVLILASYLFDIKWLYRPTSHGAATHPITAFIFLLLSCACIWRKKSLKITRSLVSLAFFILVIRFYQQSTGINLIDPVLSYFIFFDTPLHAESPIEMGFNTSVMQLFAVIAIFFLLNRRPWYLIQIFAITAIFLPFVSAVGYAYGIDSFYGQMSPVTTILGFFLTISIFGLTAHRGALKTLLLPTLGAKIARTQLIFGLLFCLAGGFLTTYILDDETSGFAIYVVVVCTYITFTMLASGITYEQFDKRRRLLEKQLHKSAITDRLTGLYNRSEFDQKIQAVFEQQNLNQEINSLLLIDIDFFKQFNDTYGHLLGDKVLQLVANVLKNNTRSSDLVCRYGGEEFTILLLQTDLEIASKIADNLRILVSEQNLTAPLEYESDQQVTISIGCASLSQAETVKEVIKLADNALYEAKKQGRNRICLAHDKSERKTYDNF
ncbi:diguanylate cyclase [Vibrio splendidus]|uniref:diguanylate cyclase n=3 Tax=Vibrio TaxID=662 RepID=A0A2N7NFI1_9VIBR|nr:MULTISPECIES: GGDEF domain-containing protein [Vibrio]MCC4790278.1 diguanylate cyclase [Vibrio splendidus]MDH5933628.1 diguanylate cyclase [Vibrio splendidus]MDP2592346.1 GGDEF domain-containing protein [Vibrio splendidus]OEF49248.1 diguanylate cyclase [Vibrio tasmaniensis 1F-267]OEF69425.1 diguanylate cyclase [Vibrio tasmaniensis 1F-187]